MITHLHTDPNDHPQFGFDIMQLAVIKKERIVLNWRAPVRTFVMRLWAL